MAFLRRWALTTLFLLSFVVACDDPKVPSSAFPFVKSDEVTEIDELGATFHGELVGVGQGITDHGFVYAEEIINNFSTPAVEKISLGPRDEIGKFSAFATRGMIKDKLYYMRTYATSTNGGASVFGNQVTFISKGSAPPKITDFNPKQGIPGDIVLLTGSGFSSVLSNNSVLFESSGAGIFRSRADSLWFYVPAAAKTGDNTIGVKVGHQTTTTANKFNILKMEITSFEPHSVSFGDTITINGKNFPSGLGVTSVTILGKPVPTLSITRETIQVVVPTTASAVSSPVILTAGAQVVPSADQVTLKAPIITTISPTSGTKDTQVTISGDNFHPTASENKVSLAGKPITVTGVSAKSLTVKIPTGITPGSYNFSVTVTSQVTSSSEDFEIIKPEILQVMPGSGTWGTVVTITGKNFGANSPDNVVKFNNTTAQVISASPSELKVSVPNDLLTTVSDVIVQAKTTDNLTATALAAFTLDAPQLTYFEPAEGKPLSIVTINGNNFSPVASNNVVSFGSNEAKVVSATASQLSVQVPVGSDSFVEIKVAVGQQEVVSTAEYHLISPWKKVADFPGTARAGAAAFTLDGNGYVGVGTESDIVKRFYRYDPPSGQWSQVANYGPFSFGSSDGYTAMATFTIGGFGYVGVGNFGGSEKGTIRKYSAQSNSWSQVTTHPAGVSNGMGYSIDDKGYVISGVTNNNQVTAKTWEYDPGTDAWVEKAPLSKARQRAFGFTVNSKAYIIGGVGCVNCNVVLQDTWEYDPSTNQWTEKASMPGPARYDATAFSIGSYGYVVGGRGPGEPFYSEVWRYDPATNQWLALNNFPAGRVIAAAAFVIGSKAYFGTGYISVPGGFQSTKEFWEFDPSKL